MSEKYYNLSMYDILNKLYKRDLAGFSEQEIQNAEKRLDVKFPKEMKRYYFTCGKEDINYCLHRLIEPKDIYFSYEYIKGYEMKQADNYLVFWIENQGCCNWGINYKDLDKDNPEIYITTNDDLISWEVLSNSFNSFIMSMILEQITDSNWEYSEYYDEEVQDIINKYNIDVLKLMSENTYLNENTRIVTCIDNENLFMFSKNMNNKDILEYVIVVDINEYEYIN